MMLRSLVFRASLKRNNNALRNGLFNSNFGGQSNSSLTNKTKITNKIDCNNYFSTTTTSTTPSSPSSSSSNEAIQKKTSGTTRFNNLRVQPTLKDHYSETFSFIDDDPQKWGGLVERTEKQIHPVTLDKFDPSSLSSSIPKPNAQYEDFEEVLQDFLLKVVPRGMIGHNWKVSDGAVNEGSEGNVEKLYHWNDMAEFGVNHFTPIKMETGVPHILRFIVIGWQEKSLSVRQYWGTSDIEKIGRINQAEEDYRSSLSKFQQLNQPYEQSFYRENISDQTPSKPLLSGLYSISISIPSDWLLAFKKVFWPRHAMSEKLWYTSREESASSLTKFKLEVDSKQEKKKQHAKWTSWLQGLLRVYLNHQEGKVTADDLQTYLKRRIELELEVPNSIQFKDNASKFIQQYLSKSSNNNADKNDINSMIQDLLELEKSIINNTKTQ